MPELLPTYQRLVELADGGDLESRFLSLYQPTPDLTGCSQAVWTRDQPRLIRNYDYDPSMWEAALLHTSRNGREVITMSVTRLDASGRHRMVFVAPDRMPVVTNKHLATNHQEQVEWHEHAVATVIHNPLPSVAGVLLKRHHLRR